jgi:hypothetical protein
MVNKIIVVVYAYAKYICRIRVEGGLDMKNPVRVLGFG